MCAAHTFQTPGQRLAAQQLALATLLGVLYSVPLMDTALRHRLAAARTHGGTIRTGTLQWMAQYELTEPRKNLLMLLLFCAADKVLAPDHNCVQQDSPCTGLAVYASTTHAKAACAYKDSHTRLLHGDEHGRLDLGRIIAKCGADSAAAVAANVQQRGMDLRSACGAMSE